MKRVLNLAIVLLSVVFMALVVVDQWHRLQSVSWSFNLDFFVLAVIGIVALFLLDAYCWHLILRALNQSMPAILSIRIWVLSSITRYLPGGFWPYLSRISLARDRGLRVAALSISLYLETLLLAMSSLAVGLPALMGAANLPITPWTGGLILILFGLLMHPRIIALLRYVPGKIGRSMEQIELPGLARLAGLYVFYVLFWILFGVFFVCFVNAVYPVPSDKMIQAGSSIALSFFIGYVIFFFPGGIGLRETTLYLLLIGSFPHEVCLLISISSRLWVMLGEGLSILLVLVMGTPKKVDKDKE